MGNGMNKIVPGLFIGNFRDSKDEVQLQDNKITHVLAIHDQAKPLHSHLEYLCIIASDTPGQELRQFFPQCIEFIHKARLNGGNVLVHCLAGVSRSVTVSVAYLMTETKFGWRDTLNAVRGSRTVANPNFGFQKQLMEYEEKDIVKARKDFNVTFPNNPLRVSDTEELTILRDKHWQWVLNGEEETTYPLPSNAYNTSNNAKSADNSNVSTQCPQVPKTVIVDKEWADKKEKVARRRGTASVEQLLEPHLD